MRWGGPKKQTYAADTGPSPVAEHARMLLNATITEIGRADTKAAILMTGSGLVLGTGASVLVAEASRLSHLHARIAVPLLIAIASAVAALISLGAAAYLAAPDRVRSVTAL